MGAYNQVTYESLHPVSDLDIEKTKALMNSYIAGNYTLLGKDIPRLIAPSSMQQSTDNQEIKVSNVNLTTNIDKLFENTSSNRGKLEINKKNCKTVEDMVREEKGEYIQEIKRQSS